MGTNYTQCVHRIRIRPVIPQHQPEDRKTIEPSNFEKDPLLGKYRSEPGLSDESLPKLLDDIQPDNGGQSNHPDAGVQIRLSIPIGGPAAKPITPAVVPPIPAVAAAPIVAPLPPVPPPKNHCRHQQFHRTQTQNHKPHLTLNIMMDSLTTSRCTMQR